MKVQGLRSKVQGPLTSVFSVISVVNFLAVSVSAQTPSWWTNRNVLSTNAAHDYAAANQGQVKWVATMAYDELEETLPGGAGSNVAALVSGFSPSNNFLPVNLGQLKHVAQPFYARLIAVGYTSQYPWTGAAVTSDYALANLGQVKNLFSFDPGKDEDADGLADWWELIWWGNTTAQSGAGDPDGDGLCNAEDPLPLTAEPSLELTSTDADLQARARRTHREKLG